MAQTLPGGTLRARGRGLAFRNRLQRRVLSWSEGAGSEVCVSERGAELSAEAQRSLRLVLANTADVVGCWAPTGSASGCRPRSPRCWASKPPNCLAPVRRCYTRRPGRCDPGAAVGVGSSRHPPAAAGAGGDRRGRYSLGGRRDGLCGGLRRAGCCTRWPRGVTSAHRCAPRRRSPRPRRGTDCWPRTPQMRSSTTPDARYTWFSPSVTSLLGWQPEQLYGMRPADLCHPDDVDRVRAAVTSVGASGSANLRARLRTASGDHRWVG